MPQHTQQLASQHTPQLTLYHSPGACSQVCVFALEQARLPYQLKLVDLQANEQSSPAYAAVSPLGKVPALVVDGEVLFENAAIQTYIAHLRPQAELFPLNPTPLELGKRQAGLSFCGGNLHPIVRGLANPQRITEGDPQGVRQKSTYLARKSFGFAQSRLEATGWWLDQWSSVDIYLNWAVSVAASTGFDFTPYPRLAGLNARLMELPAFVRTMKIEADSRQTLQRNRGQ